MVFVRRLERCASKRSRVVWCGAVLAVLASLCTLLGTVAPASAVGGASFTVGVLTDSVDAAPGNGVCADATGACSLRAAVQESNALGSPANTITLAAGATYGLTLKGTPDTSGVGDLDVTSAVVIEGNGAKIDAAALAANPSPVPDRVLEVSGTGSATIRSTTIAGGHSAGTESGGGIQTAGALVLDRVFLMDNVTSGHGGGVFYNSSSSGSITSSVILHNQAAMKGGGLRANANLTVTSSTISHNTATTPSQGMGVFAGDNTTITFVGTLLDNPLGSPPAASTDCVVSPTNGHTASAGYNLSRSASGVCSLTQPTDKPSSSPSLYLDFVPIPGTTGSGIDAGGTSCPALDIFGTSRPRGIGCEIGAYELPVTFVVNTTSDSVDATVGDGVCANAAGQCSLRAAVMEGNALLGPKTIQLASAATYPLTLKGLPDTSAVGDLDVTGPTVIVGNGSTVDAAGLTPIVTGSTYGDRVLEVSGTGSVTIGSLTLAGGNTDTSGGAIQAAGPVSLDRVVVRDNKAASSGGGVFLNSASAGTITTSVFVHNTALKGGGIRANKTLTLASSTISHNTATTPSNGQGLMVGDNAAVTLAGTLIDNPTTTGAGGTDCFVSTVNGAITSTGYNLSRSAASVCRLTGTGDQPDTDPGALWLDIVPTAGSPAIDHGGPACPATDFNGSSRPLGYACDVGAFEQSSRSYDVTKAMATGAASPTIARELIGRAYARYRTGDPSGGHNDLVTLSQLAYTGTNSSPGFGVTPIPTTWTTAQFYTWDFEFDFINLARLEVVDPTAAWLADPIRPTVLQWINDHANVCKRDTNTDGVSDWFADTHGTGPWTVNGSENHMLMASVSCLLSLYATRATNGTAWQQWANALKTWVRTDARNGLLGEIMSPIYGKYSMSAIMNMADFTPDTELRTLTRRWLDVFWQDVALNYNALSKAAGASGSRMYQFDPDPSPNPVVGSYWGNVPQQWFRLWTWMYGWHDTTAGAPQAALSSSASDYVPLVMSKQVANATGKAISYTSLRPSATGAGTNLNPGAVRRVEQNDDYLLGAQTYDPTVTSNPAMTEGIWAGVSLNGTDPNARVIISGVGEEKGDNDTFTDYNGINARLSNNVIVAARDRKAGTPENNAGNTRGIRVWFAPGPLRTNLQADVGGSGWWFTTSGNTYVAVRFAAPVEARTTTGDAPGVFSELRVSDPLGSQNGHCDNRDNTTPHGCCPPTGPDCWTPVVVQVGRAAQGYTFGTFKAAVLDAASPRYAYNTTTGTVTYRSLAGQNFSIRRQIATNPPEAITVDGSAVSTATTAPYAGTPYLTMGVGSTTATLCGPLPATCVTRSFA